MSKFDFKSGYSMGFEEGFKQAKTLILGGPGELPNPFFGQSAIEGLTTFHPPNSKLKEALEAIKEYCKLSPKCSNCILNKNGGCQILKFPDEWNIEYMLGKVKEDKHEYTT